MTDMDYKSYFKGKKVTVVGLGLLGKLIGDIAFLAQCGAELIVTDLKTAEQLAPSIKKLQKYKNITYVLGEHRMQDFENRDFILKGQGVPLDSIYIAHACKNSIPIEMDESLFVKLAPQINVIGVTGTRGKSTTTVLIYEILKSAGMRVHLGGNIRGTSALPLLKIVKAGDTIVFELSSWQLQGFGEAKLSPHISVFINFMPDHLNYYKNDLKKYFADKAYIYKFQTKNDFLITAPSMKKLVGDAKSKVIISKTATIPKSWKIQLVGKHNLENIACAVDVVRLLKIPEIKIKKAVESFKAVPGRLELVKTIRGIQIYNDTNSTTPDAGIVALNSFDKPVILILGGMDKGIDSKKLSILFAKKTKKVFLTPGSGSDLIINKKANIEKVASLKEAVMRAFTEAKKGDVVLFSPCFASFNMFKNEYDRGDQFMKLVKRLK
jgi:UDP-N-acetylmuramoylalanine--D-glutamate ligase